MKIVYDTDGRGLIELAKLQRKLGVLEGIVSRTGRAQTITAFGESMSPLDVVHHIVHDVAAKGDHALVKYSEILDRRSMRHDEIRIDPKEIREAAAKARTSLIRALSKARDNIEKFQKKIKHTCEVKVDGGGGRKFVHRTKPFHRVGLYVPCGRAAYPSSVLMTVVPALVAGVKEIAVATPMSDVFGARNVMAALHILGIEEAYRIGGAQAIAAFAFGTKTVPRVDMIAGPGNIFVTLAKREVVGIVGIDSLAGPSEVLIIADSSADHEAIAADLIAQAEHDPAASVLVTTEGKLAEAVAGEVDQQILELTRGPLARASLDAFGLIVVVADMKRAVELAEAFAPEHLQIVAKGADKIAEGITNAGAIFVGPSTPVAVGDYYAGPSHVLPTGGGARFSSGLSVNSFMKSATTISYTAKALKEDLADIEALAIAEGLTGHARSVDIRVRGKVPGPKKPAAPEAAPAPPAATPMVEKPQAEKPVEEKPAEEKAKSDKPAASKPSAAKPGKAGRPRKKPSPEAGP